MLRDPNGPPKSTHTPALEALSQMVPFYPEAAEKLLEQARLNQIPDTLWQNIAKALTGGKFYIGNPAEMGLTPKSGDTTYHLSAGPQDFGMIADGVQLTPEQIDQNLKFIDKVLEGNPSPAAIEPLQKAKTTLSGKKGS